MSKKRIVVVANKWWECDPVLSALLNNNARPVQALGWPQWLQTVRARPNQAHLPPENPAPAPRAIFALSHTDVELWCVSDLLEHTPDQGRYQSSSQQKALQLPKIFQSRPADLLISVGTAAFPDAGRTQNGNVTIGTRVFMHNGHPNGENPDSNWQSGPFDKLIDGGLDEDSFRRITAFDSSMKPTIADRFLVPPLNPADGSLLCDASSVALGTLNVTDPAEYDKADKATIAAYGQAANPAKAVSLETTHGLIRVQSEAPFLFVSGIVNRVGFFAQEVAPRSYSQNTAGANNAGVALGWLLARIDDYFSVVGQNRR